MNKRKTQKYGTVNQNDSLKLKYSRNTRENGIAGKETIEREVELSASAYEDVPEYLDPSAACAIRSTVNQLSFDLWTFKGYGDESHMDKEEGGLYLSPDTRYTDACRDVFIMWKQDILEALSEANL